MIWGVDRSGNLVGYGERKMLMKVKRTKAKADRTLAEYRADRAKKVQTQEELDRAFIAQFKQLILSTPMGPNTVILHLLVHALDRLKV